MLTYTVQTFQNEYLHAGATEVHAIVTVAAQGLPFDASMVTQSDAAEIIILDSSGSMGGQRKLSQACRAAAVAISRLRDDVEFAVIAGNQTVHQLYPAAGHLARSSPSTRTVQAPQISTSHERIVPSRPSRSRSTSSTKSRGSTASRPPPP